MKRRRSRKTNVVTMPGADSVGSTGPSGRRDGPPTPKEIDRRAHEIYESRGRAHGHDLDDWLRAERELHGAAAADTVEKNRHDADDNQSTITRATMPEVGKHQRVGGNDGSQQSAGAVRGRTAGHV